MGKRIQRRTFLSGSIVTAAALAGASFSRAAPANHQITIKGFSYDPGVLNIAAGDTVSWTNRDSAPHTVSDVGDAWSSESLRKDDSFALTFTGAGQYDYFCKFHPKMKATIIVS